jgi:hypothetical protein
VTRKLVRSLPRFIQDPLLERRWFRRLWRGHFERWSVDKGDHYGVEWFPMMACTEQNPAWFYVVAGRMPELMQLQACEEH